MINTTPSEGPRLKLNALRNTKLYSFIILNFKKRENSRMDPVLFLSVNGCTFDVLTRNRDTEMAA